MRAVHSTEFASRLLFNFSTEQNTLQVFKNRKINITRVSVFLAVQDSSISDLVTQSVSDSSFDFNYNNSNDFNEYNDYNDYKDYNNYNNNYIDHNDYNDHNY